MKHKEIERLKEIWIDIKGYEGYYQVSNIGNVKSLDRNVNGSKYRSKIRKPFLLNSGYLAVSLSKNGVAKSYSIHRLMLENFTISSNWCEQVNHKDLNKLNNILSNLEWCTRSENNKHSYDNGERKRIRGSEIGTSKLKEEDIPYIRNSFPSKSMRQIGRELGVSHKCISSVLRKKSWSQI